jgi:hypothetical protein
MFVMTAGAVALAFLPGATQQSLTASQTALISTGVSAVAILTVGILNVWALGKQRHDQSELLERQLASQREQTDRQFSGQREQWSTELKEQRALRILELREEGAKLLRTEKSAAYAKALFACHNERVNWDRLATLAPDLLVHELPTLQEEVMRNREAALYSAAELELVSSESVYAALLAFQEATTGLLGAFIRASESLIAASGGPSLDTLAGAQAALRETIVSRGVTELYDDLLDRMRRELFDLALDSTLRPSKEDQDLLREEVRRLGDQLPAS